MDLVRDSLRHCVANLTNFGGRDAPGLFWPYAMVVAGAATATMVIATFVEAFKFVGEAQAGDTPNVPLPVVATAFAAGAVAVLLAAAVARRLHDIGRRGLWAAWPVVHLAIGLAGMYQVTRVIERDGEPNLDWFLALLANNVLYLILLVSLIVAVTRRSDGPNRFGPGPHPVPGTNVAGIAPPAEVNH